MKKLDENYSLIFVWFFFFKIIMFANFLNFDIFLELKKVDQHFVTFYAVRILKKCYRSTLIKYTRR